MTAVIVTACIASTLTGALAFIVGYAYGVHSEHDLHERERERERTSTKGREPVLPDQTQPAPATAGYYNGPHYGGLKL